MSEEVSSLRDRLCMLEQDKVNIQTEKERREKDCRNLQVEVNRMNTVLQNYKSSMGDMHPSRVPMDMPVKHSFVTENEQTNVSWMSHSSQNN